VVPKRADSFGNEAYSTKIMEFMSVGVPVVVSSTKIDRFYFNDSIVRFFPSGDVDALAGAMIELLAHPDLRRQMAARGLAYAARSNWDCRRAAYLQLVDSLIAGEAGDLKLPPDPSISGDGELADTKEPVPRPRELVLN
jgi:glycosyltransferase involved in cell wall biosynthesis